MRIALVLVLVLVACGTSERSWGVYAEQRRVTVSADKAGRGMGLVPGSNLVLMFFHTSSPRVGCASEQMRQTELWVELPRRPDDGHVIELASTHALYRYGGQIVVFSSERCRGTLVVSSKREALDTTIDATCTDPSTSEERHFADTVELERRAD